MIANDQELKVTLERIATFQAQTARLGNIKDMVDRGNGCRGV